MSEALGDAAITVRMVPRATTKRGRQWPRKWRGACRCGWRGPGHLRRGSAWEDATVHALIDHKAWGPPSGE